MQYQIFGDFDEFAESICGVVSDMTMRNPTQHRWTLRVLDLQDVDVQLGQLGSGNIAQGQLRADRTMLYLPLTPGAEYSANGVVLHRDSFVILEPGCEFCISTKTAHDWCALTLPNNLLSRGTQDFMSETGSTLRVTERNQQAAGQFREIVQQTIAVATKTKQFESSPAAFNASAELQKVAADVLRQSPDGNLRLGRPKIPRDQIIDRTRNQLQQCESAVVLVRDLAAAAGVSERTLRNAFNDYFGISPVRYLQYRQLNQVHRALRATEPDATSVSGLLVQHGVWEFSRFAARYRRLFGELPSETLRRPMKSRATPG